MCMKVTFECFMYIKVSQSELDQDTVKTILNEYKIHNADITLRYDATAEDLIDVIEGNRVYIPCIYLLNKIDQISIEVRAKATSFILIFVTCQINTPRVLKSIREGRLAVCGVHILPVCLYLCP